MMATTEDTLESLIRAGYRVLVTWDADANCFVAKALPHGGRRLDWESLQGATVSEAVYRLGRELLPVV